MIQLYGDANSRAFRCLWMLEELGVAFEHVKTSPFNGDTRTPAFLAVNPNGHVPALVDGELRLFESMAINLYLASAYAKAPLWPAERADQARIVQWSFWAMTECEANGFEVLFVRGSGDFAKWRAWSETEEFRATHPTGRMPSEETARAAEAALRLSLAVLDEHLSGRDYILGGVFSAADLNVASILVSVMLANLDLASFPNVAAWLGRCFARPAVTKAAARRSTD